jgi:AcrR family transcriptional regulator/predicted DNA-binding transcriptional regulator AlpA
MEAEIKLFRISELERFSGVPRHTIHQYIRHGLLPEPIKAGKTMAYYDESHLERLQAIQRIKGSSRVPLAFLKKVLEESEAGEESDSDRKRSEKSDEHKRETAAKRRQQIREAAGRMFLDKGFQRTTVQDITGAAGVSTGTFYLYYRNKQELFIDVIDDLTRKTVEIIEDMASQESDFMKRIITTAQFYMDNYKSFYGIIYMLQGMIAEAEPSALEKYVALHDQLADPIMREIRAAIKRGLIRDVNPELLSRTIMGMVEFLTMFLTFKNKYTSAQAISFMIDVVLNGIGKA